LGRRGSCQAETADQNFGRAGENRGKARFLLSQMIGKGHGTRDIEKIGLTRGSPSQIAKRRMKSALRKNFVINNWLKPVAWAILEHSLRPFTLAAFHYTIELQQSLAEG